MNLSLSHYVAIALVAFMVYLYVRGKKVGSAKHTDPFLDMLADTKKLIDNQVELSTQELEQGLKEKFSEDLELKRRLSGYAQANGLDKALIEVWRRVSYYGDACEEHGEEVVTEINGLDMVGGHKNDDGYDVAEFTYNGQTYSITTHEWKGYEEETHYDVSLSENGIEVFATSCGLQIDSSGYDVKYVCGGISALKKRGDWARMLLEYQGRQELERKKSEAGWKYSGADKIKGKFEE